MIGVREFVHNVADQYGIKIDRSMAMERSMELGTAERRNQITSISEKKLLFRSWEHYSLCGAK